MCILLNMWKLDFSKIDKTLVLVTFFFLGLGLVQVYSSSFVYAIEMYGDPLKFFHKQALFTALGVLVLFVTASLSWNAIKTIGYLLWVLALFGLLLTLFPHFAIKAGGASRWVQLPFGMRIEPSELLKMTFPFALAFLMFSSIDKLGRFKWPMIALHFALPLGLLIKQPDFGSIVIITLMTLMVLFVFGLKFRFIAVSVMVTLPIFLMLIVTSSYRMNRVKAFLDPWSDIHNKGFQVIQSTLSFHSGKLFGRGLGQGQGKLFFLPEAHTDFTLASLGEEWGFIGFFIVLSLYGLFIFRALRIAVLTSNPHARAVCVGVTSIFSLNVFINMGVVLGLLPTKGLTLPFLSYGGSSLMAMCFLVGVLLCIRRHAEESLGMESSIKRMNNRFYKI